MYRDDQNAMALRLDELSKEHEAAQHMREEILELRRALSQTPTGNPYRFGINLGPGEKAAFAAHDLMRFPTWAVGVLHFFTFGLFSLIFFGIQQGRLPRAAQNDPSTGQAIGFQFIPFFNYYWLFFSPLRLCDRVTFQYALRGRREEAPKALTLTAAILTVIPYLGMISIPILWTIAACMTQYRINRLIELGPLRAE